MIWSAGAAFLILAALGIWGSSWPVVAVSWVILAAYGTSAVIRTTKARRRPHPSSGESWRWYPGEGGPPRG